MKQTKMSILYGLNFMVFLSISLIHTQMLPLLKKLDYDVVKRGYILAGSAVIAIVAQFLFGYLCDRYRKTKPFLYTAYGILLIACCMLFLWTKQAFFYHFLIASMVLGIGKVIMGMEETWMLEIQEEAYGKCRAWGAFGFALGSPLSGLLVRAFDYQSLLYAFIATFFMSILLIFLTKETKKKQTSMLQHEDILALVKNKAYCLLVLIFLLVYMIGTADQYVVVDKMLSLDASNTQIGIKWAVQSFMEIPLFLLADRLLKKWSTYQLLIFGTLMYIVKFVLYGVFQTPMFIILTASLQVVTLPIIMLTSKIFIKEVSSERLFHSAQMFAMAIFIGVSGLITPLITSFLSKWVGYDRTLYLIAGFGIFPLLLIGYYCHMKK